MSIAAPLASPFFTGAGSALDVPGIWDCSLNGHRFMIDWKYAETGTFYRAFLRQSVPLFKPQQDNSGNVSEESLNPEDFPRRAQESWHFGAGQTFLDRPDSLPYRFGSSKGADVWTQWQLGLLNDTTLVDASANTNLAVLPVGSYLYEADGNEVYSKTSASGSRTGAVIQNGEAAQSVKSICSDGKTVYAALGSNGIHSTVRGAATSSHYSDLAATLVGYVKGRLMAAQGASIFNVIASGAAPSALLTQPNSDFTWVGFAGGPAAIYAAGYSGDKSLIYRTAVKADGTALDVPLVAGELPDGEIVRAIEGYLGFLFLGTDQGWRLVELTEAGDFSTMSDIIPTTSPVLCFEPQNRYVWYGLSNYDGQSTGLGRAWLGQFTKDLNPAYASDLMAATQGSVLSAATFAAKRVFAVSGVGFYAESANKVPSATLDSPDVTFGLPDDKVAAWLDVRFDALVGSVSVAVSADGGPFLLIGSEAQAGLTSAGFPVGNLRGQKYRVRVTLNRSGTATVGPVVHRWTLEANPAPGRGETINVPLMLAERVLCGDGVERDVDVAAETAALGSMESTGAPITFVDALGRRTVFLDDHQFEMRSMTISRDGFNGTFIAKLRRPRNQT